MLIVGIQTPRLSLKGKCLEKKKKAISTFLNIAAFEKIVIKNILGATFCFIFFTF